VSGNATLSAETGATTVVTPTATGDVTVTLTATSETGVVVTDTHTITFTERPAQQDKTVTILWGDVDLDGSADATDILAVLYGYAGKTTTWTNNGYTYEFNSSDVTDNEKTYTLNVNGTPVVWGDVDLDNSADATDMLAVLYGYAGKTTTWTKNDQEFGFNTDKQLTLTEKQN
ncbi:MAG TPA: hypothetical protein DCO93_03575, partial [Clostridiales bacterium]|nr:hypothetical protein [Clostridiales bacterium]